MIVPILLCLLYACLARSSYEAARQKYFSKKSHYRQDKSPVFVMVIKKGIFPSLIFDN